MQPSFLPAWKSPLLIGAQLCGGLVPQRNSPQHRDLTASGRIVSLCHQDGPTVLIIASDCTQSRGIFFCRKYSQYTYLEAEVKDRLSLGNRSGTEAF